MKGHNELPNKYNTVYKSTFNYIIIAVLLQNNLVLIINKLYNYVCEKVTSTERLFYVQIKLQLGLIL